MVDLSSFIAKVAIPAGSLGGRMLPGLSGMVYMANPVSGEVAFVRAATSSVAKRVLVSPGPGHMGLDPLRRKLYVVCAERDELVVVDASMRKADAVVQVGRSPYGIAIIDE